MAEKELTTFYPLTKEELQAACREVNSEVEPNHENEGHRIVEHPQHAKNQENEELLTKIKALSDKMIGTQDPDIIRGCVKEIQMNSPNADFAEFCKSFFTGDSTRVDVRREVLRLFDEFKRKQIMADIELVAKKHNMPVDELLELITESEES